MTKCIGIIGSRRRTSLKDYYKVRDAFLSIYENGDSIVSGGCTRGGDEFAERIAKSEEVPITIHYAQWGIHGRAAGFIRNGDIAGQSDVIIACVSKDRTGGTEDTLKKFKGEVVIV
jgi:hypothetical protein